MRAIILAAGQGTVLDGIVKCLIRSPKSGKSILEQQIEAFQGCKITVVVGYRAVEIMQLYPNLDYIYNPNWTLTNNAYSLGLALDESPCFVVSGDLMFKRTLIEDLKSLSPDIALVSPRENRTLSAINCMMTDNRIMETYVGPLKEANHPEAVGLFKMSTLSLLRAWKENCLKHGNLFVGQTLPLGSSQPPVHPHILSSSEFFYEINTVFDYMRLLKEHHA